MTHRSDDDWYEDPEVFFGFGSVHDLRDADSPPPRLAGLHSVNQVNISLKPRPRMRKHPCGFHIPKVRR